MRLLRVSFIAVLGSVVVGCGGGGGGGGGGSGVVFTPLPPGINNTFRPPTNTQQFSTSSSGSGSPYASHRDMSAESVSYTFGGTVGSNGTIAGVSSPSSGTATFLYRPYSPSPLNEFDAVVNISGTGVADFSGNFILTQASRLATSYARVPVGSAVNGAPTGSPGTQIAFIGTAFNDSTSGTSKSLLLGDWTNTQPSGPLSGGLNLSHTIFGRWAENIPTPALNQADRVGVFAFGSQVSGTGGTAMPTVGTATYTGGFIGVYLVGPSNLGNNGKFEADGFATLSANFATNSMSLSTSNTRIYVSAGQNVAGQSLIPPGLDIPANSNSLTISGSAYSGSVSGVNAPSGLRGGGQLIGTVQGQFYGPDAIETGGTFRIGNGASGANAEVLIGGFGARRGAIVP